jgi:hypothetical protein
MYLGKFGTHDDIWDDIWENASDYPFSDFEERFESSREELRLSLLITRVLENGEIVEHIFVGNNFLDGLSQQIIETEGGHVFR